MGSSSPRGVVREQPLKELLSRSQLFTQNSIPLSFPIDAYSQGLDDLIIQAMLLTKSHQLILQLEAGIAVRPVSTFNPPLLADPSPIFSSPSSDLSHHRRELLSPDSHLALLLLDGLLEGSWL